MEEKRFEECDTCKAGFVKDICTCEDDQEVGYISMLCPTCGCFYNKEIEKGVDE